MASANVETLRRGYDALNRGDLSVVLELLDADIEWHEPSPSPDAGAHRGRDSFERFLRGWLESFDGFRVEPEQVVEHGSDLVAVVRQTGTVSSTSRPTRRPCSPQLRGRSGPAAGSRSRTSSRPSSCPRA
jgi:ketosteroid isomerase-like protein